MTETDRETAGHTAMPYRQQPRHRDTSETTSGTYKWLDIRHRKKASQSRQRRKHTSESSLCLEQINNLNGIHTESESHKQGEIYASDKVISTVTLWKDRVVPPLRPYGFYWVCLQVKRT